jgi:hypothetical protein
LREKAGCDKGDHNKQKAGEWKQGSALTANPEGEIDRERDERGAEAEGDQHDDPSDANVGRPWVAFTVFEGHALSARQLGMMRRGYASG